MNFRGSWTKVMRAGQAGTQMCSSARHTVRSCFMLHCVHVHRLSATERQLLPMTQWLVALAQVIRIFGAYCSIAPCRLAVGDVVVSYLRGCAPKGNHLVMMLSI